MKFERTKVFNFEGALRGMRNPLESWDKSDSSWCDIRDCHVEKCAGCNCYNYEKEPYKCALVDDNKEYQNIEMKYHIGKNDLELAQKLIKAGSVHRKFMRQIFVSVDITAPQYFWAEFDTYKVGIVRNSTSMQHKGVSHKYTIDNFEVEDNVKEVLCIKEKEISPLIYRYDTTEYRIYTCENGRRYKVFKNGKIYSCEYDLTDNTGRTRHFEEKECVPSITNAGYYELNLGGRNGEKWLLHRLVATCWLDNLERFSTVDHINMNKGDNCVENLEWVSLEENIEREWKVSKGFDLQKAYKNWKMSSKMTPPERMKVKDLYKNGHSQKKISEMTGLSQSQISVIIRGVNDTSENKELFENCWYWEQIINNLNILRDKYLETKDYKYFRMIRQLMPMGYLYKSTVTMNYENLLCICSEGQRRNHKLIEWSESFINWAKSLPYSNELLFLN